MAGEGHNDLDALLDGEGAPGAAGAPGRSMLLPLNDVHTPYSTLPPQTRSRALAAPRRAGGPLAGL